jgi:hypothetical protein
LRVKDEREKIYEAYRWNAIFERVKFGKLYPKHEVYPTTTQWGTSGWSFGPKDREIALSVAESLTNTLVVVGFE